MLLLLKKTKAAAPDRRPRAPRPIARLRRPACLGDRSHRRSEARQQDNKEAAATCSRPALGSRADRRGYSTSNPKGTARSPSREACRPSALRDQQRPGDLMRNDPCGHSAHARDGTLGARPPECLCVGRRGVVVEAVADGSMPLGDRCACFSSRRRCSLEPRRLRQAERRDPRGQVFLSFPERSDCPPNPPSPLARHLE